MVVVGEGVTRDDRRDRESWSRLFVVVQQFSSGCAGSSDDYRIHAQHCSLARFVLLCWGPPVILQTIVSPHQLLLASNFENPKPLAKTTKPPQKKQKPLTRIDGNDLTLDLLSMKGSSVIMMDKVDDSLSSSDVPYPVGTRVWVTTPYLQDSGIVLQVGCEYTKDDDADGNNNNNKSKEEEEDEEEKGTKIYRDGIRIKLQVSNTKQIFPPSYVMPLSSFDLLLLSSASSSLVYSQPTWRTIPES